LQAIAAACQFVGRASGIRHNRGFAEAAADQSQALMRLRDAGLHEAEIARLHAPVGSIPSTRDPRSLAVSVLAEVVSASLHLTAPPLSRG
jgi:hypothetical protein